MDKRRRNTSRKPNPPLRLAVLGVIGVVLVAMIWTASSSLAHTKIERPVIEVSPVARMTGAAVAAADNVVITPADEAAALKRLVRLNLPLWCGGTKKYAAITFDDGPSATTPKLMKMLKDADLPTTFFDLGRNGQEMPEYLKLHADYGPLANHTWDHSNLTTLSPEDIKTQLTDTQEVFKRITGQNNMMMRPTYGARDPQSTKTVDKLGYAEMLWSADSQDALGKAQGDVESSTIAGIGPGAVLLMHDGPGVTLQALPKVIKAIKRSGLTMVTIPQLLVVNPPTTAQLRAGAQGCSHAGRVNVSGSFPTQPDYSR